MSLDTEAYATGPMEAKKSLRCFQSVDKGRFEIKILLDKLLEPEGDDEEEGLELK
jgi:hypothetical protein